MPVDIVRIPCNSQHPAHPTCNVVTTMGEWIPHVHPTCNVVTMMGEWIPHVPRHTAMSRISLILNLFSNQDPVQYSMDKSPWYVGFVVTRCIFTGVRFRSRQQQHHTASQQLHRLFLVFTKYDISAVWRISICLSGYCSTGVCSLSVPPLCSRNNCLYDMCLFLSQIVVSSPAR